MEFPLSDLETIIAAVEARGTNIALDAAALVSIGNVITYASTIWDQVKPHFMVQHGANTTIVSLNNLKAFCAARKNNRAIGLPTDSAEWMRWAFTLIELLLSGG